jgi:hypothetical protein
MGTVTSPGHDCSSKSGHLPFPARAGGSKSGHLPFSPTICGQNPYVPSPDHTCGSESVPLPLAAKSAALPTPGNIAAPNPYGELRQHTWSSYATLYLGTGLDRGRVRGSRDGQRKEIL